jgi:ribosomal protein S6
MDELKEKRNYELSFLVKERGDESNIETLLNQYGAEMLNKSPIKEVKLSYPIKKFKAAHFGYFQFKILPEAIEKISHSLKLNSAVLRMLIISPPIEKEMQKIKKTEAFKKPEIPQTSYSGKGMLTNEALEEKLEEILK